MKKLLLAFAIAAAVEPPSVHGQTYPTRPITVVVGFPAGVGTDSVGRTIAEHMKTSLGQPLVFENAPGAGGTIAAARVARAAADGYTLSLGNLGTHVVSPATYPNIQYHPLRDFEPVALLGTTAYWLVAKNTLPPKDLKELIAWLKANPDKASAAMVGTGGLDQIAATYFQQKTGTRFQLVPYRGGPPAAQDLVAGHVDMWLGGAQVTFGQVRSGQLKAYAVLADRRWFAAPDVPSTAEMGLPDLAITFWMGLWAPKTTPKDVVAKINAAVMAAHADPTTRQRLREQGVEPPSAEHGSPEAFGAFQKAALEKWWPVIKSANITAQ